MTLALQSCESEEKVCNEPKKNQRSKERDAFFDDAIEHSDRSASATRITPGDAPFMTAHISARDQCVVCRT
jgi:hypothetical protein